MTEAEKCELEAIAALLFKEHGPDAARLVWEFVDKHYLSY
jgi:hypothetical protein